MGGFLNLHNGPNTVDSDSDESPNKLWRELAVQVRDSKRYLEYCQRPSMTGRAKGSLPRHASSGTLHRETSWNVNLSSLNYRKFTTDDQREQRLLRTASTPAPVRILEIPGPDERQAVPAGGSRAPALARGSSLPITQMQRLCIQESQGA